MNFIENLLQDEISKCSDIYSILKLLCIDNLTVGNIKSTVYDKLKKDIITLYGNKERFLFENLEHLKILQRKPDNKKINFQQIYSLLYVEFFNIIMYNKDKATYILIESKSAKNQESEHTPLLFKIFIADYMLHETPNLQQLFFF